MPNPARKPRRIDGQKRIVLTSEALAELEADTGDYVTVEPENKTVRLRKVQWNLDEKNEDDPES